MNTLYSNLSLDGIYTIGFDMDGTLYDEFDFITQVYSEIVNQSEGLIQSDNTKKKWMNERWLNKGSSYPYIFRETFKKFGKNKDCEAEFVDYAVKTYRNFNPKLNLSNRAKFALDFFASKYPIFLITDGNSDLQRKKFNSLGLEQWFNEESVFFTGDFSRSHHKPSTGIVSHLDLNCSNEKVLYFGDRDIDKKFCEMVGFNFQMVNSMKMVT